MTDPIDSLLVPNFDLAVEFLTKMHPKKPRLLVAIKPDKTGPGPAITVKTFQAEETEAMGQWIDDNNRAGLGLYFSVASTMNPINRKAKREDISEVTSLHVDIDANDSAGESVENAKATGLEALASMKDGIPLPTAIVDSGNGLQAHWSLTSPVLVHGNIDIANEVAKHNRHLEKVFGADNCHNVDRVLRVPYTINWPNEKKRKLGRKPVLARLLEYHPERVYDISVFPKLEPDEKSKNRTNRTTTELVVPKNVERLKDIDDLDERNVPSRIKTIIVHGRHPDEGPKENDDSRSAWLLDVVCDLTRCCVPTDAIFAIITDPAYKISESVLESSDPEKYAMRQIERAKQFAVDPQLLEMNDRHAVIENHGGRCVVIEEVYDEVLGRSYLTIQSFEEFKKRYCNQLIEVRDDIKGKSRYIRKGNWWLEHPQRRTYQKVIFAPNRDVPGAYNLWKGFAVEAIAGDWSRFREHIRAVICSGNEEHFSYLIQWLARCVQEPEGSGQVAVVLRGEKGCGKSIFVEPFGRLFGQHYQMTTNAEHIAGRFNEHLKTMVVLFGDEAFFAGNKDHERTLKGLVTQDELSFEGKGRPVEVGRNHVHLLLASNSTWVVPAHGKERRFFVLDVSAKRIRDLEYFEAIDQQMKSGGSEAMLHDLLHMDLTGFEVRDFPQTAALREQQQESAEFEETTMVEILTNGFTPDCERYLCKANELSGICLLEFARELGFVGSSEEKHSCLTRLGQFVRRLARLNADGKPVSRRRRRRYNGSTNSRVTVYELRPLAELRKEFDHLVGPDGWPESPSEWTSGADVQRHDPSDVPF